jgi:hypothetical protein
MFGQYSTFYQGRRTLKELQAVAQRHHPLTQIRARKVANNTIEFELPASRAPKRVVQHQDTEIVIFNPDGSLTLDSGGWRTVTTKERMNRYLPLGWGLYSDRGWKVRTPMATYAFFDGMTLRRDGTLSAAQQRRMDRHARQAEADKKLIARAIKRLNAKGWDDPSGDPWLVPDERGLFPAAIVRGWLKAGRIPYLFVAQAYQHAGRRYMPRDMRGVSSHFNAPLRRFLKACLGIGV